MRKVLAIVKNIPLYSCEQNERSFGNCKECTTIKLYGSLQIIVNRYKQVIVGSYVLGGKTMGSSNWWQGRRAMLSPHLQLCLVG